MPQGRRSTFYEYETKGAGMPEPWGLMGFGFFSREGNIR